MVNPPPAFRAPSVVSPFAKSPWYVRSVSLHRTAWTALSGTLIIGLVGLHVTPDGTGIPCPLRTLTGIPCPLCGMTTSLRALSRLQLRAMFFANPFAPVLVGAALFAIVSTYMFRRTAPFRIALPLLILLGSASWIFQLFRYHIL
ncbi:MAG: DUF2752 domain-containing protein [Candidatus Dormibacteria bacterium]